MLYSPKTEFLIGLDGRLYHISPLPPTKGMELVALFKHLYEVMLEHKGTFADAYLTDKRLQAIVHGVVQLHGIDADNISLDQLAELLLPVGDRKHGILVVVNGLSHKDVGTSTIEEAEKTYNKIAASLWKLSGSLQDMLLAMERVPTDVLLAIMEEHIKLNAEATGDNKAKAKNYANELKEKYGAQQAQQAEA